MALREHPLTGIDRMPIYIDRLLGDVKLSHKNVAARPKGRYSYTCKPEATGDTTVTGSIRWVTIPDAVPPQTGKIDDIPRKSRRPPIDITLDELISTADEVGEKTGKTHYAAVLRRVKDQGLLKRARGGSTSVADGLRLDGVHAAVFGGDAERATKDGCLPPWQGVDDVVGLCEQSVVAGALVVDVRQCRRALPGEAGGDRWFFVHVHMLCVRRSRASFPAFSGRDRKVPRRTAGKPAEEALKRPTGATNAVHRLRSHAGGRHSPLNLGVPPIGCR